MLTRRDLLKRGTIAGVVWATPAVQAVSMMRSAAAAVSPETSAVATLTPLDVVCEGGSKYVIYELFNATAGPSAKTLFVRLTYQGCDATNAISVADYYLAPGEIVKKGPWLVGAGRACTETLSVDVWENNVGGALLATLVETYTYTGNEC